MNRVMSLIKNLRLRQTIIVLLVALTVFITPVFGNSNLQQAQADDRLDSPLGKYYKGEPSGGSSGTRPDTTNVHNDNKVVDKAKKNIKETADNVRDTLNTDTVKTPEGKYYKATPGASPTSDGGNILETIKEKLNLDEEPPRATKEFLHNTQSRVEKTVEPVTGKSEGYYQ